MISLVGRESEQAEICRLVESARSGLSGVLVVRGEAGIGKTCMLDAVTTTAADFDFVRLVGIESEMRLGFAALHQLLMPFLHEIDSLPEPQARALKSAFGMVDDEARDQFLVGLAALTLITSAATRQPLLIVVDDAQWLDQDSADALGFVARRLYADHVCVLIAIRDSVIHHDGFDGLPSVTLTPLSETASAALLDAAVAEPLADDIRARLLADARGNPLALVEFSRELSSAQHLAGAAHRPEPLAVDRRLEQHFLRQVGTLPPATQRLLLVAAAEPTGDAATVWRAGRELDFGEDAIVPAQAAGLLEHGREVVFRHPLIRSAVYQGAGNTERCRAHEALALATDPDRDPEQKAWHRATAAQSPDEDVAAELERAAQRVGGRGGSAASAALLARAAELTPDTSMRAIRWLGAAGAELMAGNSLPARANLERALPDLHEPLLVAHSRHIEAGIEWIDSSPRSRTATDEQGRLGDATAVMLDAARAFAPLDLGLAREAALNALQMAVYFGDASAVPAIDVAIATRTFTPPAESEPTAVDRMVDAIAETIAAGFDSAGPLLRDALVAVENDVKTRADPRQLTRACWIAFALSDDDALQTLATEAVTISREQGIFQLLGEALDYLGLREVRLGALARADDIFTEVIALHVVFRRESGTSLAGQLLVSAWRGRESEVRAETAALALRSAELGLVIRYLDYALMVLELGLGNYQAAASHARPHKNEDLALGGLRAADTVEAHVRSGDHAAAHDALAHLADRASSNQSALDLGLLARSTALMADDADAEAHYRDSIARLEKCGAQLHLARTQLVFGEWLRRQKRRRDARGQLEAARATFEAAGAHGFAERARVELLATGAQARKRVDETRHDLTPQESQVARLAVGGLTNPEIAARLFISANTVDYHLRKVYRKLDIKSRHELSRVVPVD